jgi:ribonuclease HI
MREASVHTRRTRDATSAAPGRLGNEHHRCYCQARLDEKVRQGYHPRRGGRYDSEEDQSPSPEPPGPQAFSRAIRRAPFPARFWAPTTITKYSGETRPELWLADYRLACQLGGTDDDNLIIRNLIISEVLFETKIRYPQIQKLLYVVILTRRKLRHYFESHPVIVVSSFPLGEIIQCREASGRIAKWAVEIMGETISFAPRKAIKSQVLADFVAEWVDTQLPMAPIQPELWTMYFDGSLMKIGAGAGLLFISPLGKHLRYMLCLHFPASNNVAEYEALVNGLRIAIELGVRCLDARGDSQLVIDQVMKNSHCRDRKMEAYCDKVRRLEDKFYGLELNHIARRYNETADELVKIASGQTTVPPDVFSRDIHQPSIKTDDTPEPEVSSAAEGEALRVEGERNGVTPNRNWQTTYLQYLHRGELPLDKAEARQLARRAKSFVLLGDEKELYHRSPSGILQRCISVAEG